MTKRVTLLLDTDVWLDNYLSARPGHPVANRLLDLAARCDADLLVPLVSLKDFFYLMQVELKRCVTAGTDTPAPGDIGAIREIAWAALENLSEIATVVGGDGSDAWTARKHRTIHDDFEDDLVIAAALRSKASFLVTRDERLLRHAPVAALSPKDMVSYLEARLA